ncbi:hypothetical protein [Nocardioides litoris]|uniref:hypothetical protein n=1 Tax=Nocardioides litoris TaxID=1926648 RepID=UPI0011203EA0|nr:hypothetical protein [Nocardioides litoris]
MPTTAQPSTRRPALGRTEPDAKRAEAVDRWTASVTALLDERRDLRGVTKMADLVHDATRWSA